MTLDDVFLAQDARAGDFLAAHTAVELHAADGRQVIALAVEEQILETGSRQQSLVGGSPGRIMR